GDETTGRLGLRLRRAADRGGVGQGRQGHDKRLVAGGLVVRILQLRVVLVLGREQPDEIALVFLFQLRAVHHHVQRLQRRFLFLQDVPLVPRRDTFGMMMGSFCPFSTSLTLSLPMSMPASLIMFFSHLPVSDGIFRRFAYVEAVPIFGDKDRKSGV